VGVLESGWVKKTLPSWVGLGAFKRGISGESSSFFCSSTFCHARHSRQHCGSREQPLPAGDLTLDFPASRTVRNIYSL
jgi:hypothetical protein